jgi:hypothetical protein
MQLDPTRPLRITLGDFFDTKLGQQTPKMFAELYSDEAA